MRPRFDRRSSSSSRPRRQDGRRSNPNSQRINNSSRFRPLKEGSFKGDKRDSKVEDISNSLTNSSNYRNSRIERSNSEFPSSSNRKSSRNEISRRTNNQKILRRDYRNDPRIPSRDLSINSDPLYGEAGSDAQIFGKTPPVDLLWGRHAVLAALTSGRPIHRIWCTSDLRSSPRFLQLLRESKSSGVLVEEVTWGRLAQLTCGAVHQGIALQTAASETLDLTSLIEGCKLLDESPLLLALDGLTDPQNLGAIVRSAEAFGAHGMILPQRRSAGLTGSVAKVAAGALEHLPVARVVNLNRSLCELKDSGYRVIGLAEEGNMTLSEVDLEGPLVLVTGSEGKGISVLTKRNCDQLIRIPLRGVTPSLNASVATAIVMYEVARRGWMKGVLGQTPSPKLVRPKCLPLDNPLTDF